MPQKKYLLVGLTGSGKSTAGNALINKSGEIGKLTKHPFVSSDSADGCTTSFLSFETETCYVIDTVGFGDPKLHSGRILEQFRQIMKAMDNKINAVIYVVKAGKFTNETIEFFKIVQEKVLKNKCNSNSLLLVTHSRKGWVNEQSSNEFVQKALSNCNHKYFEFNLAFDDLDFDDENDRIKNLIKRQKSVDSLHEFLNNNQFESIDISFIQSSEFKNAWITVIVPLVFTVLRMYYPSLAPIIDSVNNYEGECPIL